jgi:predicted RNase H-like HicB family nuclease
MTLEFTAVYKRVPLGYVAWVEELPGANTQGSTLEEARENLREAVELILEVNRSQAREAAGNEHVIRESLKIASG